MNVLIWVPGRHQITLLCLEVEKLWYPCPIGSDFVVATHCFLIQLNGDT